VTLKSVDFSPELRDAVERGDVTLSYRRWQRPKVKEGGRYASAGLDVTVVVDAIELLPFGTITAADVARCGEPDVETLRRRTAHAGPVDDETLVYRIEFHVE
jgi:hypothetical protein